jgi:hypothetical protein
MIRHKILFYPILFTLVIAIVFLIFKPNIWIPYQKMK